MSLRHTQMFQARISTSSGACRRLLVVMQMGAIWVVGFGGFASSVMTNQIAIEMRSPIEVKAVRVTLGDISSVQARNPELQQRLKSLPLGYAPRVGESVCIQRQAIESWIRKQIGIEPSQITWTGPRASSIRVATQQIPGDRIASCGRNFLLSEIEQREIQAEVQLTQNPRDAIVPFGHLGLNARTQGNLTSSLWSQLDSEVGSSKHPSVWVDLWVDGKYIRSVPVRFQVNFARSNMAIEDVVMEDAEASDVHRPRLSGETWKASLVESKTFTGDTLAKKNATRQLSIVNSVATAKSPSTDMDRTPQLKKNSAPMVFCGGTAMLRLNQGEIQLESRVEVLQDGQLGQNIRVKRFGSTSAMLARVVGPGLVEVR